MKLQSYLCGAWHDGAGPGIALTDPVTAEELVRVSGDGLDMAAALAYARQRGGPALRALSFAERAKLLADVAAVLTSHKERYGEIALRNSGNTATDAAFDIDGGIGTLKYYAGLGRKLGETKTLVEAGSDQLTRDEAFRGIHLWSAVHGVAVHINAFNFPSWGLWEKAAVALLAGVPFLAKPATATAWLAAEMVGDVVAAGVLPDGALSLLCGGGRDLMDHLAPGDVVSFTGSADTGRMLRSHPNVVAANIRFAVEADSLNLCCLGPDVSPEADEFALFVREIVGEMTVKAGQKCTAIRRVLVPRAQVDAVTQALAAKLAGVVVGDPRNPDVRMGPLVSKAQQGAAWDGLERLLAETQVVCGADRHWAPAAIDPAKGCFFPPTVLVCPDPMMARAVHEVEVFGPVVTVMAYDDVDQAVALARQGGGSLVASVFSGDNDFAQSFVMAIASAHGRVLIVDAAVGKSQSGHGVVMPQSVHGGPGRAGGGEELGGLRGLRFYMQRTAIQGRAGRLDAIITASTQTSL